MKSCPTCHRHSKDSLTYCSRDGAILVAGDRQCTNCLHKFPASFRFCTFDGAALLDSNVTRPHKTVRLLLSTAASVALFFVGAHIGGASAQQASGVQVQIRVYSNSKAGAGRVVTESVLAAPLALTPCADKGSRKN